MVEGCLDRLCRGAERAPLYRVFPGAVGARQASQIQSHSRNIGISVAVGLSPDNRGSYCRTVGRLKQCDQS